MKRTHLALVLALGAAACSAEQAPAPTESSLTVGDAAPSFTLPTADGTFVSLGDLRGRPALLYFSMGPG